MAAAILVSTLLLAFCSSANSQTANLTFSKQYPAEIDEVIVTCNAPTIADLSDMSMLTFFDTTSKNYFQMTRNCITTVFSESTTGFGQAVKLIVSSDQKVSLQWTYFPTEYNSLLFQCSITSCSTGQRVESNTASITALANPATPTIQPYKPWVNENVLSYVTLSCEGFVGYPGGNLELQLQDYSSSSIITTSLANFSSDAQGNANGTYVLSRLSNRRNNNNYRANCLGYNILNSRVSLSFAFGNYFQVAYPPKRIVFSYAGVTVKEESGPSTVDLVSPFTNQKLSCKYDEAVPAATITFTQIGGFNVTGLTISFNPSQNFFSFQYSGTGSFTLVFNCSVYYESLADPNIKTLLTEVATVNVRSMATMPSVSHVMLLLSILAALSKF